MKNFSDIQALLDRYWEGETTLEEERILKAYFGSGEVDERLHAIAPLFQALREEQNIQYAKTRTAPLKPVMFNWQRLAVAASAALLLSAGLWWWTGKEKQATEYVVHQPAPETRQDTQLKSNALPETNEKSTAPTEVTHPKVAAKEPAKKRKKAELPKPKTEAIDPETEAAMEEIKAALALVSSKLKKGKQEAVKGAIHLENVEKISRIRSEG